MSDNTIIRQGVLVSAHPLGPEGRPYPWHHDYVERYWLSVLGPSATWIYRRLCSGLELEPTGYPLALESLAAEVGLSRGTGTSSPVVRSITRLIRFGVASIAGWELLVHLHMKPLSPNALARLPEHLRLVHGTERILAA